MKQIELDHLLQIAIAEFPELVWTEDGNTITALFGDKGDFTISLATRGKCCAALFWIEINDDNFIWTVVDAFFEESNIELLKKAFALSRSWLQQNTKEFTNV